MNPIEDLIAPYLAAMTGGDVNMAQDPIYGPLFRLALREATSRPASTPVTPPPPGQASPANATSGGSVSNAGDTEYNYRTWEKPFLGLQPESPLLVERRGVTLQRGPMRSLVDIARESDVLPGLQEINRILQGYRSPEQQASAYATNPNAAAPGYSYHPQGLAIDAGWWSQYPELARALSTAGWSRYSPSGEPWHWSYGVVG